MKERQKTRILYGFSKRTLDIILSVTALLILFLPMFIIALTIKFSDKGTVLFTANRLGKSGKNFKMYKFRTMRVGSDSIEKFLSEEELKQYKIEYKLENDPRVTEIGKFLRKSSLDELPQLINIIKGNMSIVGPRPVLPEEVLLYGENMDKFLSVKPGLTGYWQAYARNTIGYSDGARQEMELHYIDHRNMWFDIKIVFATVRRVFNGKGAC